jgi:HlyD family secretion protein
MNKRIRNYSAVGIALAGLAVAGYLFFSRSSTDPDSTYLTVQVTRGPIERTISATGALRAVITVQVGSQVSGRIQELYADFNSVVTKGQKLALIDPSNFEAQRERARAGLATAEAAVKNSVANITSREAELVSAKANLEAAQISRQQAERELTRTQELSADKLVTKQILEEAQAALDETRARLGQAAAQVSQAEASIHSAMAQKEQAGANVQQALAELRVAEVNLRYTTINSPIDGIVIERNVDIGQTVAASLQAPILFVIANDLSRMRLTTQVDEADIGVVSEKAKVEFTVDAFPGQSFQGKISEIRLNGTPGEGTSNVVVYDVIIDVDNPHLQLRPGMTATVSLTVSHLDDTLKVANTALRYHPSSPTGKGGQEATSRRADLRRSGSAHKEAESPDSSPGIQPVLAPSGDQYGIKAGLKVHFPDAEVGRPTRGTVWVLSAKGQPERRRVALGITDGRETAVLDGELAEGEAVITQEIVAVTRPQETTSSPFRTAGRRGR